MRGWNSLWESHPLSWYSGRFKLCSPGEMQRGDLSSNSSSGEFSFFFNSCLWAEFGKAGESHLLVAMENVREFNFKGQ